MTGEVEGPEVQEANTTADSAEVKEAAFLFELRSQALALHQKTVGRGDKLIEILERAVDQMETSHRRLQNMSTILFGAGLILLAAGVAQVIIGGANQGVWGALLGGTGGIATLAATFWTAPLDKISDSVSDLVKLEAAFLGYIRVIGEIDSAFQMQYLDILAGKSPLTLYEVTDKTTTQMKTMMEHTLVLIDRYVVGPGHALSELQKLTASVDERLTALEAAQAPENP
ncbi:MAG: hypothetical protein PVI07_17730 [Anaerolineae bacterium]|jgi:hypothetical protein